MSIIGGNSSNSSNNSNSTVVITWPMRKTIITSAATLGVVGVGGALLGPATDIPIIVGVWTTMIMTLSSQADALPITRDRAGKFAAALISQVALFAAGMKIGSMCFTLSGVGTPIAILLNVAGNSSVTYMCGVSIATILLQKRDLTLDDLTLVAASAVSHVEGRKHG